MGRLTRKIADFAQKSFALTCALATVYFLGVSLRNVYVFRQHRLANLAATESQTEQADTGQTSAPQTKEVMLQSLCLFNTLYCLIFCNSARIFDRLDFFAIDGLSAGYIIMIWLYI